MKTPNPVQKPFLPLLILALVATLANESVSQAGGVTVGGGGTSSRYFYTRCTEAEGILMRALAKSNQAANEDENFERAIQILKGGLTQALSSTTLAQNSNLRLWITRAIEMTENFEEASAEQKPKVADAAIKHYFVIQKFTQNIIRSQDGLKSGEKSELQAMKLNASWHQWFLDVSYLANVPSEKPVLAVTHADFLAMAGLWIDWTLEDIKLGSDTNTQGTLVPALFDCVRPRLEDLKTELNSIQALNSSDPTTQKNIRVMRASREFFAALKILAETLKIDPKQCPTYE
jgi:hypothetical protein